MKRLRKGEITALLGALALAALLAVRWFELRSPVATVGQSETGFMALGWFVLIFVLPAIGLAIWMAIATATGRSPAVPIGLAVVTTAVGGFATLAIAIRLLAQPGLGVDAPNEEVAVLPAAIFGLGAAAILTIGAWQAMADERTDTPESHEQTERVLSVRGARRPAPPPDGGAA